MFLLFGICVTLSLLKSSSRNAVFLSPAQNICISTCQFRNAATHLARSLRPRCKWFRRLRTLGRCTTRCPRAELWRCGARSGQGRSPGTAPRVRYQPTVGGSSSYRGREKRTSKPIRDSNSVDHFFVKFSMSQQEASGSRLEEDASRV